MEKQKGGILFVSGLVVGAAVTILLSAVRSRKSRPPRLRSAEDTNDAMISAEDGGDFQAAGKYLLQWIVNYRENTVRDHPVISTVAPNYLANLLPSEAPVDEEFWPQIFKDIDSAIVPGLTSW